MEVNLVNMSQQDDHVINCLVACADIKVKLFDNQQLAKAEEVTARLNELPDVKVRVKRAGTQGIITGRISHLYRKGEMEDVERADGIVKQLVSIIETEIGDKLTYNENFGYGIIKTDENLLIFGTPSK